MEIGKTARECPEWDRSWCLIKARHCPMRSPICAEGKMMAERMFRRRTTRRARAAVTQESNSERI